MPQHVVDQNNIEAALKAEAVVQQQLCSQTATVLCAALQDLGDALFSNVQRNESVSQMPEASSTFEVLHFPKAIERKLIAAFLPPQLRLLEGHPAGERPGTSGITDVSGSTCEKSVDFLLPLALSSCKSTEGDEALEKAALYILYSVKASCISRASMEDYSSSRIYILFQ